MVKENENCKKKYIYLIFSLIFLIYSNTFFSSWHLDDYPNIVRNSNLHLKSLDYNSLVKTFFAAPGGSDNFYRPVACFSFAINWFFVQDRVFIYHLTNIFIHFISALFLFFSIILLFKTPNFKNIPLTSVYFTAFLSTVLWAINPVQTQAVTYIVQRMASLCAMFYIMGIFYYLKGRISKKIKNRLFYFFCCFTAFFLSLGSKENSASFPVSLILVELIFFSDFNSFKENKKFYASLSGFFLLFIFLTFFVFKFNPFSFIDGYKLRSFTLTQRLFTEPVVVIFYISQIFYPLSNRFSIEHDFNISTSFFEPASTFFAILSILVFIFIGIVNIKKRPLLSFSILFFFLNHVIESTVIPLELVFEHRNYLPSMFIFVPVAFYLKKLIDFYEKKNRFVFIVIYVFIAVIVFSVSMSTYVRNMAWATEKTLWEDAAKKADNKARPLHILAKKYYKKRGDYAKALKLYKLSFFKNAPYAANSKALSLIGIGGIYYNYKDYNKVIAVCQQALKIKPGYKSALFNIMLSLIHTEKWNQASKISDILLEKEQNNIVYNNFKALILLNQNKPGKALSFLSKFDLNNLHDHEVTTKHERQLRPRPEFKEVFHINLSNINTLIYTGSALSRVEKFNESELFLNRAYSLYPQDMRTLFYLIENSMRENKEVKAEFYADILIKKYSPFQIFNGLEKISKNHFMPPLFLGLIKNVISDRLIKI